MIGFLLFCMYTCPHVCNHEATNFKPYVHVHVFIKDSLEDLRTGLKFRKPETDMPVPHYFKQV